ncbi:hypothetical protein GCM10020220_075180 [Nonomuraea rubra]
MIAGQLRLGAAVARRQHMRTVLVIVTALTLTVLLYRSRATGPVAIVPCWPFVRWLFGWGLGEPADLDDSSGRRCAVEAASALWVAVFPTSRSGLVAVFGGVIVKRRHAPGAQLSWAVGAAIGITRWPAGRGVGAPDASRPAVRREAPAGSPALVRSLVVRAS